MSTPTASLGSTRIGRHVERTPLHVWIFLAGLFFAVFSGNTRLMGLPIGPDRLLLPVAVLLLLLHPDRPKVRPAAVHAAMAALVFVTIMSMLQFGTYTDSVAQFALLDRIIWPFALFTLGPIFFDTPHRRRVLLVFLTCVGAWLALNAVFEYFGPRSLVWPRYIVAAIPTEEHRASGAFLASEALGMSLAMSAFAAFTLSLTSRGAARRAAAVVGPLCLLASVLTLTRSVWLGGLVGAVTLAVLSPGLRRFVAASFGAAIVSTAVVAATSPQLVTALTERFSTSRSLYDRANTNAAALRAISEEPLTGVGWGRFIHVAEEWVRQSPDYPVTHVNIEIHNVFLSRAAELGIIGGVLYTLCLVLGPVAVIWRTRRSAPAGWTGFAIACFVVWLIPSLTSPNPYPYPNFIAWLIWGVLSHGVLTYRRDSPSVLAPDHGGGSRL